MTARGPRKFKYIERKNNSIKYKNILVVNLLSFFENLNNRNVTFQHVLTPAHNSKSTKSWLERNEIYCPWRANSSDLNIIQNAWNKIKFVIRHLEPLPKTKDHLKRVIY